VSGSTFFTLQFIIHVRVNFKSRDYLCTYYKINTEKNVKLNSLVKENYIAINAEKVLNNHYICFTGNQI
jgi:hypothetical protein